MTTSFALSASLSEFFGEPARRYVVKRSFAYWQAERRVFGIILWGRPDESDVEEICAAHEVGANPLFRGHTSLVDLRALESVDFLAFAKLLAYLKKRRDAWSPMVSRQAVLHRGGFAHATVAGMFEFFRPQHPVVFFDDAEAAYDAVGASDVRPDIESLRGTLLGTPDIVRRLHALLDDDAMLRGEPNDVARRLGMSVRTLQRHLGTVGTTFRQERHAMMVRRSERLLETTDLDLDAIAAAVGASSASHLVTLFRQLRGMTPGQHRKLTSGAGGPARL